MIYEVYNEPVIAFLNKEFIRADIFISNNPRMDRPCVGDLVHLTSHIDGHGEGAVPCFITDEYLRSNPADEFRYNPQMARYRLTYQGGRVEWLFASQFYIEESSFYTNRNKTRVKMKTQSGLLANMVNHNE